MKNMNLIYAATDAAANFAKAANQISMILTIYMDEGSKKYSEEETIERIKDVIAETIIWAPEIFNGILTDGINP
jgi:hypothetical protein